MINQLPPLSRLDETGLEPADDEDSKILLSELLLNEETRKYAI